MIYNEVQAELEVLNILKGKLGIPEDAFHTEYMDKPLTGSHFKLSGVQMAYLFFEIEKKLGISIDSRYLSSYGFCSIRKIVETICNYVY